MVSTAIVVMAVDVWFVWNEIRTLAWLVHLGALSVWSAKFTLSLESIGLVPPPYSASKAAWCWWLPGFNLVWPGRLLMGFVRSTGDGSARGASGVAVAWWGLAVSACLLRTYYWAISPTTDTAIGLTSDEGLWVTRVALTSTVVELLAFVLFIGLAIWIQAGWARRAVHAG